MGTFKYQLISAGSLFVITGNPLEPGSMSSAGNQGKQKDGGGVECMSVHLHRMQVDLTVTLHHKTPQGGGNSHKDLLQAVI